MDFKKVLPLLLVLMYLSTAVPSVMAADNDIDELCKQIDDLNTGATPGCVDPDDADEMLISGGLVFFGVIVGLSSIIVLALLLGWLFGLRAKKRSV